MYETPPPRRAVASWLKGPRLLTVSERKGSVDLARIRTRLLASRVELRVADNE